MGLSGVRLVIVGVGEERYFGVKENRERRYWVREWEKRSW